MAGPGSNFTNEILQAMQEAMQRKAQQVGDVTNFRGWIRPPVSGLPTPTELYGPGSDYDFVSPPRGSFVEQLPFRHPPMGDNDNR